MPFSAIFRNGRELGLVAGLLLILTVLFSPIPSIFLDLAILINFGLALTILLLTLYVSKPVEFSTFPSLLLISTLLRLSINVAATRLILTSGNAGEVINSIGAFAVGGNFVVGLVVFFILIVVQYVVVTAGAQRVSEVAARFTLDSMPGQQMSIDADLNMGLIDQKEALRRRKELESEGSFYGSMDGASKFVKGDAIAGVIILLIDIIAGWIIGVVQMNMGWAEALRHFTLLTIGDGIATQLPALIISTATGIIVTRSGADRELSTEIFRQLLSTPRILVVVGGVLALLLLLPGMPKWPILVLAAGAALAWGRMRQSKTLPDVASDEDELDASRPANRQVPILSVALGAGLASAWKPREAVIMDRISNLRTAHEAALGIPFPPTQLIDDKQIGRFEYEIRLFGARHAHGEIDPDLWLAIRGEQTKGAIEGIATTEPAFGLPAVWIEPERADAARQAGYTVVDPLSAFTTHLGNTLEAEAPALLTRATVTALLDGVRARQPGLIEEITPNLLSVSDIQRVLQNLLAENVSVATMDLIAEHLVDLARAEKDLSNLTELLRQRLGVIICNKLKERHRDLAVMSLDPRLENQVLTATAASGKRDGLAVDPRLAEQLIRRLSLAAGDMQRTGRQPVLLCSGEIRRQMRALTRRALPKLAVLSVAEMPLNIDLTSHAVVRLEEDERPKAPVTALPRAAELTGEPHAFH